MNMKNGIEYAKAGFLVRFRYKANSVLQVAGTIIIVLIQFYLWSAIGNNTDIGIENILMYTVIARIVLSLYPDYTTINFIAIILLNVEYYLYFVILINMTLFVFYI